MTQETYITLQLANIDLALEMGRMAIETAKSLEGVIAAQDEEKKDNERYFLDAMRYYDFNSILKCMESMPVQLKDFKNQLIEIKIANDKMLMEGGFIAFIDSEIAKVFLDHTLCKLAWEDPKIIPAIEDAIAVLKNVKKQLAEIK